MTQTDDARGPDLILCPFCGGDDQYLTEDARDHGFIGCHECHARGPIADQVGDWTRPYTAWNTRADLAPTPLADPRVVALLREAREDLAAYVENDYPEATRNQFPDIQRRWDRDMELCRRIDAALAALSPTGGNDE